MYEKKLAQSPLLRKIAADDFDNLGDISTLAEPGVVDELIENRQNRS